MERKNLPGSGILYDLGSHLIDQALSIFGKPDAISADVIKQRPGAEVDDYFHIVLHYGVKRVILRSSSYVKKLNAFYSAWRERFYREVRYGFAGRAIKNGMKPGDNGYGVDDEENFATLETEESLERIPTEVGCYDNYYKGVRDSILNSEKLPVTAKEGLDVIKLIQLAIESSDKGRVISIK